MASAVCAVFTSQEATPTALQSRCIASTPQMCRIKWKCANLMVKIGSSPWRCAISRNSRKLHRMKGLFVEEIGQRLGKLKNLSKKTCGREHFERRRYHSIYRATHRATRLRHSIYFVQSSLLQFSINTSYSSRSLARPYNCSHT